MWWEKRRDRWAEKMECEKATIPAGVPWFLDPDFEPSLEDIAAGIKVAMKYGLLNE